VVVEKKASDLSRQERLGLVDWAGRESDALPISVQASLLGLNRSSLYYRPISSPDEIALKHRIDEIYTAHRFYGSRRVTVQLRREGLLSNRKAVQRHMREMGIEGIAPGPHRSRPNPDHEIYPYLLRGLPILEPNHVWGIDITYIRLARGWAYLVAILDWFSRFVISWEMDLTLELPFVLATVDRALQLAHPGILNSDQGSHFTSPAYLGLLKAAEITISMDGKGRATDNIFTERLWRTLKYEDVYLNDYADPREARLGIGRTSTSTTMSDLTKPLATGPQPRSTPQESGRRPGPPPKINPETSALAPPTASHLPRLNPSPEGRFCSLT
jgi:putative transposase